MVQLTEEKMAHIKELRKKAMKLPLHPGVYIMHSRDDTIIYIGKAKALKNRVSQYFGSDKNHNEKVRRMVSNVEYFEYILTDSEFEALILESSLIKQHQPKYNILLKDDKGYSYIKVTAGDWPRISETKQVLNDGAKYIGPYLSAWTIKDTVEEARKIFRLPSCTRKFPQEIGRGRPCLNYYIKQCCAPCRGHVSQKEYNEAVQEALDFIRGGTSDSVRTLTEKMNEAAENLDFELAARIRDRITAINKLKERQKVVASRVPEQDVIALVLGGEKVSIQVFRFAGGRLYDRESFLLNADDEPEQIRSEFVMQYYSMRDKIPPVITIDGSVNDDGVLEEWLTKKAERRVKFHIPQKGEQKQLVEMCRTNAAEALAQAMGRATGRETSALDELRQLLNLPKTPEYIESYDISNLAGTENVAGMIVYKNGKPLKSAYRKFKIKGFEGQDDYASMAEVLTRRFDEYYKNPDENEGFGKLPDLILLDGGKGQVAAVKEVLQSKNIDVPLFGLVKDDKHKTRAVTGEGGEIALSPGRSLFAFLAKMQDEVHRFAIGYHHSRRSKNTFKSSLTGIEGIGEVRARSLLKYFRTIENISNADLAELENAPKMTKEAALAVYKYYHQQDENKTE